MIETILSARIGSFTVDTAAIKVDVVPSLPNSEAVKLKDPVGAHLIQPKDNVLIKSIAVVLPYCFSLADDRIAVRLGYYDNAGPGYRGISQINYDGILWIYSENIEQELNAFWTWDNTFIPAQPDTHFMAIAETHIAPDNDTATPDTIMNVSMINAPAALHEAELPVYCFLRTIHTLPFLSPAP